MPHTQPQVKRTVPSIAVHCSWLSTPMLMFLVAIKVEPAMAVDRLWGNTLGGAFSTAGNWTGGVVPGAADVANFTLNNSYTVTFSGPVTNTGLDIEQGTIVFDLNQNTYTLTNSSGAVRVGNVSNQIGQLTVRDGTLAVDTAADNVTIGSNTGIGIMTVTTNGRLGDDTLRPRVYVGQSGIGTLTVNGNGRIDGDSFYMGWTDGASGEAIISGPSAVADWSGSAQIGIAGSGTIRVQNGGTFTSSSGTSYIGTTLGAQGTAYVEGAGSLWAFYHVYVGEFGEGNLYVRSGAQAFSESTAVIGRGVSGIGSALVSGADSLWNQWSALIVGQEGRGTLTVADGGTVVSMEGILGYVVNSQGSAAITGADSTWAMDTLTVGSSGTGELAVSNGGEVQAATALLGSTATGSGTATVTGAGSRLRVTGAAVIGSGGWGTLAVANQGEVHVGTDLTVGDPVGAPYGQLNLEGGSIFVNDDLINEGNLFFSDGLLQVRGDFQASGAPAALVLNGTLFDQLPTLDLVGTGTITNYTSLTVGDDQRGQLLLRQGRSLNVGANNVSIGARPGSEGVVRLESSAWLSTSGTLAIGGQGTTAGGTGVLTISGGSHVFANSLELFADGTLNLDGGVLTVTGSLNSHGGRFNWTSGDLTVHTLTTLSTSILGPSRTLRTGQILRTGNATYPTLSLTEPTIIDGGQLIAWSLDNQSNLELRSGKVSAFNSVQNTGLLLLHSPLAVLEGVVQNGNTLRGTGTIAGNFTNTATGQVEVVTGDRLRLTGTSNSNAGHISVIGGELQIDNALTNEANTGLISARDAILRFDTVTNNGSMAFSNGTVDVYGDISQNVGGRITVSNGGTANFYDDVTISPGAATVQATALGSTVSRIVFFGSYNGGVSGGGQAFIEGDHRPGNSPGLVTFGGDVAYGPFARLEIELAGSIPGSEFDALDVAGIAALGGTLDVKLLNGFLPTLGDTYGIIKAAGGISGTFDVEYLPKLTPLLRLHAFYEASSVTLAIVPALTGDYNADGIVDAADYIVWRNLLGQNGTGLAADGNGDQVINQLDYDIWRAHFGQTAGGGAVAGAHVAVPEPATLSVAVLALVVPMFIRGRSHWPRRKPASGI